MDCKNFDALDDMCKGCLSGSTSVNPKEQECHEALVKMTTIRCGQSNTTQQFVSFVGLINGLNNHDNENKFYEVNKMESVSYKERWEELKDYIEQLHELQDEGCRGCDRPATDCRKCMQDYYWKNIHYYFT